jgi:hypothetical protein
LELAALTRFQVTLSLLIAMARAISQTAAFGKETQPHFLNMQGVGKRVVNNKIL